jgi:anti-anti-sigma factor
VVRIIFKSDDRYCGPAPAFVPPDAEAATSEEPLPTATIRPERTFAMHEDPEPDGRLRLTLLGDLDLTSTETFSTRLAELSAARQPVRLDLSQLAFIDSSGVQAVLAAVTDARWIGWQLEVVPHVSPSVERAARIVGIARVLWPQDPDPSRADTATLGPTGAA